MQIRADHKLVLPVLVPCQHMVPSWFRLQLTFALFQHIFPHMGKTWPQTGIITPAFVRGSNQSAHIRLQEDSSLSLRAFIFSAQDRQKNEYRGSGVAIYSGEPGVVTKGRNLGQPDLVNQSVFHFAGFGWEQALEDFAGSLSQADLAACAAVRYCGDEPVEPWRALSLRDLITQISGQWFHDVLNENRLIAHFQPIYSLKSCRTVGFEALARGVEPDGLRSGFELSSTASRLGLMKVFDQRARLAACDCLCGHLQDEESIFLNLAPAEYSSGCDEIHMTVFALRNAGIQPSQVVFELTESDGFPNQSALLNLVACIRESGAKIALDDFGSGHSTVAMCEIVRPDIVKFDRSLIQSDDCEAKEAVTRALVGFCRALGAQTVAEGIETVSQLAFAERCGFDNIQGWLVGHPAAIPHRPKLELQQSLIGP